MREYTVGSGLGMLTMACAFSALGGLGCSSEAAGTSVNEAPASYHKDIAPLVEVKCAGCHVEGGIAPFALTTYDDIKAMAPAMKAAVNAKTMPPWPASDTCTDYLGDRSLTDQQISRLVGWIDNGMPEGNAGEAPVEVQDNRLGLSRVDLELPMPIAYTPKLSPDEYRCFYVDWPETETTYVTGVGVTPGYTPIVHHVIAFLAPPEVLPEFDALDAADAAPGWTCFGGPGGSPGKASWVGAWVPGSLGADLPEGTGIEIPPGSKLIVQMHYNTSTTEPAPDQTKLLLKTDKTVEKKAAMLPYTNFSWVKAKTMDIPAHTNDVTHTFSGDLTKFAGFISNGAVSPNVPLTIYNIGAHMHTHGTNIELGITRSTGATECMVDIPRWNFHWQGSYTFTQPKVIEPGDEISMKCVYDNPGMTDMNWGEGTGDEMCLSTFFVTE